VPGGLDHIVHAVRDLDAAAARYASFGFTVGARNRHPWGTHNVLVQFPGFFVELLTVGEPEKIVPPGPRQLSFGAFTRDFLARREGFSMLVLESRIRVRMRRLSTRPSSAASRCSTSSAKASAPTAAP
jgi:hypothetical protein